MSNDFNVRYHIKNLAVTPNEIAIARKRLAQKERKLVKNPSKAVKFTMATALITTNLAFQTHLSKDVHDVKTEVIETSNKAKKSVNTYNPDKTNVKAEEIVSSAKKDYGKQYYSESGKPQIATVVKDEAQAYSNSMVRVLPAEEVSKIVTVGVKDDTFNPYVTYYTKDKNAEVYAPQGGTVIKSDDKSLVIEHQNHKEKYLSVVKGIDTKIKENTTIKQGEVLGKAVDGIVKFTVAQKFNGTEASDFVHPNKFVDTKKSSLLNYKTGKVEKPVQTEVVSQQTTKNSLPPATNKATKDQREVVEKLPYGQLILEKSDKYGVDPVLVAAVMTQESGFDKNNESGAGALGLMQLMPATAKGLGVSVSERSNPEKNVDAGVRYLRDLIKMFDGDVVKAVYSYNGGQGNMQKWIKYGIKPSAEGLGDSKLWDSLNIPAKDRPRKETCEYFTKVFNHYKEYNGKSLTNTTSSQSKDAAESTSPQENSKQIKLANVDYKQWLLPEDSGVNLEKVDYKLLLTVANLAKDHGKPITVSSGYRSIEKQAELYKGYKQGLPGYNQAAEPGKSNHNSGFAIDVNGWMQNLSDEEFAKYGLHRPVRGENWHLETTDTKGKTFAEVRKLEKATSESYEKEVKADSKQEEETSKIKDVSNNVSKDNESETQKSDNKSDEKKNEATSKSDKDSSNSSDEKKEEKASNAKDKEDKNKPKEEEQSSNSSDSTESEQVETDKPKESNEHSDSKGESSAKEEKTDKKESDKANEQLPNEKAEEHKDKKQNEENKSDSDKAGTKAELEKQMKEKLSESEEGSFIYHKFFN
ncbi:transglycosylase SLT domain-containing protein [Priestia megaterium]|uniref:transglycosylase SLT domain-containing protein n=1 Tax=Priestia megaterium TaxID=1404 RepID=UPI002E1F6648|nr:transglycosylase SLT domain-containing protein [Priestia megaterium]